MDLTTVSTLAWGEVREASRNRWLWISALAFAAIGVALARAGMASAGYAGLGSFERTGASLVQVILLFVPLIGLIVGAGMLAPDRESGVLAYLLSQPVSVPEVFFGKLLGGALAVVGTVSFGFALAGAAIAYQGGGDPVAFLVLAGLTLLLAVVSLGIGVLVSAATRKGATATGIVLLLWLTLVFGADIGYLGAALVLHPPPSVLLALLVLNPLQAFKLAAIIHLGIDVQVLGPVGLHAVERFGGDLVPLLTGLTAVWIFAVLAGAFLLFDWRAQP